MESIFSLAIDIILIAWIPMLGVSVIRANKGLTSNDESKRWYAFYTLCFSAIKCCGSVLFVSVALFAIARIGTHFGDWAIPRDIFKAFALLSLASYFTMILIAGYYYFPTNETNE